MSGYYTRKELLQLWVDSTDPSYHTPFVEKGDGEGLEVFNQSFAQFERVSQAIRNTFQSMYIQPHSGQSAEPASGDRFAHVTLSLSRSNASDSGFVVMPQGVCVRETVFDHGHDGAVQVQTGREFALWDCVAWKAHQSSQNALGVCTVPGWGGNNPIPNSLVVWRQDGNQLRGSRVNVQAGVPRGVVTAIMGDGFIPAHVGQYLRFDGGMNSGVRRRIVGHHAPAQGHEGKVELASDMVFRIDNVSGDFIVGEGVHVGGATGTVVFVDADTMVIERRSGLIDLVTVTGDSSGASADLVSLDVTGMLGAFKVGLISGEFLLHEQVVQSGSGATGTFAIRLGQVIYIKPSSGAVFDGVNQIVGMTSSATATPLIMVFDPMLMPEPFQTASWSILSWADDFGISGTNESRPEGGRSGMLDALGMERGMPRIEGEDDEDYRKRISQLADTVSPNSILRALVRGLEPLGVTGCFREVGQAKLKGFFYDVDPASAPESAFAYDMDPDLRPQDRWKVYLDYASFRAFFLIGIPPTSHGEFGFAYDGHPLGAYDANSYLSFYDGWPVQAANTAKSLWADINHRKAAGVGFEFYKETDGCV